MTDSSFGAFCFRLNGDAQSYAKILSGIDIANPDRIVCKIYDKKYLLIESAEQTNDTIGWYAINSKAIEKCLQANNLLWCYVIETAPKSQPFIYMFIGEDISREYLENEMKEATESIPEGRNYYIEEGSFASMGKKLSYVKYSSKRSDFLRFYLYLCHVIDDFACLELQH